jgi:hypothetical protein
MPIVGASASFNAAGAPRPGYVGVQIPGTAFLGLEAAPGLALLLSQGAPTPGAQWIGQSAAQTI